jgi:uncharacterized protein YkwD
VLAVASPASAVAPTTRAASIESRILSLIDQSRARWHRTNLVMVPGLRAVARQHSRDMAAAGRLSHAGFSSRIARFHGPDYAACEDVAWYRPASDPGDAALAQHIFDQWLHSPPHKACMLDSRKLRTNTAGVGVFRDAAGKWWATLEAVRK